MMSWLVVTFDRVVNGSPPSPFVLITPLVVKWQAVGCLSKTSTVLGRSSQDVEQYVHLAKTFWHALSGCLGYYRTICALELPFGPKVEMQHQSTHASLWE